MEAIVFIVVFFFVLALLDDGNDHDHGPLLP